MTRIQLVVSDVDGTLLTKDKTLTDAARDAVHRLRDAGIGFTITSSRPTIGMRFLVEPLGISLPIGPFNGSAIVDPQMNPIEQHLIPAAAAQRCIEVLNDFGVDVWLFTHDTWFVANPDGAYVPNEQRAIRADPSVIADFTPYLSHACKIVGASPDPALLIRCEDAMRQALGTRATAVRSQTYYLDVTPPGCDKGTFVETIARHLEIPTTGDRHHRRHAERHRDVQGERPVDRHGQCDGRRQDPRDPCHEVERTRRICKSRGDDPGRQ